EGEAKQQAARADPGGVAPLEGLVSYPAGLAAPRLIQSRLERGPTASCAINALWVTPARHSRGAAQATNSQKVGCANGTPWAMRARRPRARYDRRGERSLAAAAGKVFVLTFCAAGSGHTASSTRSASAMVAVLFVRTFTISAETGTIGKGQSTSHARRSRASIGPGTQAALPASRRASFCTRTCPGS